MSPRIVIHGRRQIGTNARTPLGASGGGTATPPSGPAEQVEPESTSTAARRTRQRADRELGVGHRLDDEGAGGTPAATSASASSRRFSSSHRITTSGASATIASMSGSLVPPTVGQRRLLAEAGTATGLTPEREQGLGGRRDEADDAHRPACRGRRRANPARYMRLSSSAFLAWNSASVRWPWSRSRASWLIWSPMLGAGRAPAPAAAAARRRVAHAVHLAVVVRLHLDVDLLLDVARAAGCPRSAGRRPCWPTRSRGRPGRACARRCPARRRRC